MRIIRIAMLCAVVFLLAASPVFAADESNDSLMNLTISIVWEDQDNSFSTRPNEVPLVLTKNGINFQEITLSASDNWTIEIENLLPFLLHPPLWMLFPTMLPQSGLLNLLAIQGNIGFNIQQIPTGVHLPIQLISFSIHPQKTCFRSLTVLRHLISFSIRMKMENCLLIRMVLLFSNVLREKRIFLSPAVLILYLYLT